MNSILISSGVRAYLKLLFIAFTLASAELMAAGPCEQVENLNQLVKSCSDNKVYETAALNCYRSIEAANLIHFKEIQKTIQINHLKVNQPQLNKSMTEGQEAEVSHFSNILPSLTQEALLKNHATKIIESKSQQIAFLKSYMNNLAYPDGWDVENDGKDHQNEFFNEHSCYQSTRDNIKSLISQMNQDNEMLSNEISASGFNTNEFASFFQSSKIDLENIIQARDCRCESGNGLKPPSACGAGYSRKVQKMYEENRGQMISCCRPQSVQDYLRKCFNACGQPGRAIAKSKHTMGRACDASNGSVGRRYGLVYKPHHGSHHWED